MVSKRQNNEAKIEDFNKIKVNYDIGFLGSIMGGIFLATLTSTTNIIKINLTSLVGWMSITVLCAWFILLYLLGLFFVYFMIVKKNIKTMLLGFFVVASMVCVYFMYYFTQWQLKLLFLILELTLFVIVAYIVKKKKK
ncbi:MAG: hypothetical protein WC796_00045 [Candidatus Pacearchaeota archaeon]|jgi:hypothetical protein